MKRKYIILMILTPLLLGADLVTKRISEQSLAPGESVVVVEGFFNFRMALNRGAAFGLGHNWSPEFRTPFFLLVSVIALTVVVILIRKVGENEKLAPTGLSMILSGAIGNIHDRVRFGHVVDFIDLHWKHAYHWPTFNVADISITVGAALLFYYTLAMEPEKLKESLSENDGDGGQGSL